MIDPTPSAIPAATLIVLRGRADGPPDILMVERSPAMAFAPGSLVFPGGRVEAADRMVAWPADVDDGAARVAAIRETIEEAGAAIGIHPPSDAAAIARWRRALASGTSLASVLAEDGATFDLETLVPFARWRPSHRIARVYDTRFYLAPWPDGAPPPVVDATENVRAFWTSARETLAAVAERRARAIFPTLRVLERLAQFDTVATALADARAWPPDLVTSWTEWRGDTQYVCIPEGLGYPVTAVPIADAERE